MQKFLELELMQDPLLAITYCPSGAGKSSFLFISLNKSQHINANGRSSSPDLEI